MKRTKSLLTIATTLQMLFTANLAMAELEGQTREGNIGKGCCDLPGDVNNDGSVDIADLTYKVTYLFAGGPPPPCWEEMDDNGDGEIDILDLTYEINFFFLGGPPPVPCP